MRIEGINLNKQFTIYKGGQYLFKYNKTKQLVNNLKGDKVIWSFIGSISFVLVYAFLVQVVMAYLGHGTGNTLGYLVFGAYLYRFLIIYGVHRCHIIILEQYLRWRYQLFFCCCIHWLKELLLRAQMLGGFRCLL
jgi:amino acid transporter